MTGGAGPVVMRTQQGLMRRLALMGRLRLLKGELEIILALVFFCFLAVFFKSMIFMTNFKITNNSITIL